MAVTYFVSCRNVGVDCDFETRGATIEEVIEHCAEHGRREHGMMSFTPELFFKMRNCIHIETIAPREGERT